MSTPDSQPVILGRNPSPAELVAQGFYEAIEELAPAYDQVVIGQKWHEDWEDGRMRMLLVHAAQKLIDDGIVRDVGERNVAE